MPIWDFVDDFLSPCSKSGPIGHMAQHTLFDQASSSINSKEKVFNWSDMKLDSGAESGDPCARVLLLGWKWRRGYQRLVWSCRNPHAHTLWPQTQPSDPSLRDQVRSPLPTARVRASLCAWGGLYSVEYESSGHGGPWSVVQVSRTRKGLLRWHHSLRRLHALHPTAMVAHGQKPLALIFSLLLVPINNSFSLEIITLNIYINNL